MLLSVLSVGLGPSESRPSLSWAGGRLERPDGGCACTDSAEGMNAKSQKVFDMVKRMKQDGVPIDGVGLQMHISLGGAPPVKDIAANMARCAAPARCCSVS